MAAGYGAIGLPPVVIVPPFLPTVAALEVHMAEEYFTRFGPAMSRLFDINWTEQSFLLVFAFIAPALYALTAFGLYYRVPLPGARVPSFSPSFSSRAHARSWAGRGTPSAD